MSLERAEKERKKTEEKVLLSSYCLCFCFDLQISIAILSAFGIRLYINDQRVLFIVLIDNLFVYFQVQSPSTYLYGLPNPITQGARVIP